MFEQLKGFDAGFMEMYNENVLVNIILTLIISKVKNMCTSQMWEDRKCYKLLYTPEVVKLILLLLFQLFTSVIICHMFLLIFLMRDVLFNLFK